MTEQNIQFAVNALKESRWALGHGRGDRAYKRYEFLTKHATEAEKVRIHEEAQK